MTRRRRVPLTPLSHQLLLNNLLLLLELLLDVRGWECRLRLAAGLMFWAIFHPFSLPTSFRWFVDNFGHCSPILLDKRQCSRVLGSSFEPFDGFLLLFLETFKEDFGGGYSVAIVPIDEFL